MAETTEKTVGKKIMDAGLKFIEEFIPALSGDIITRFLFGGQLKPGEAAMVQQAVELAKKGQHKEAKEILAALPSGKGWADEEISLTDLIRISRKEIPGLEDVTQEQLHNLIAFLANLDAPIRENFRLGHTAEKNPELRYQNLKKFCQLETDAERMEYLKAAGFADLSPTQKFLEWFKSNPTDQEYQRLKEENKQLSGKLKQGFSKRQLRRGWFSLFPPSNK